jgi:hypothetical protein
MAKIANGELANLMELLDEQDATLYAMISENIQSYGLTAIPYLEVVGEKSLDETVQSRVKILIQTIKIQGLYGELHNWATLESSDLLKGYLICSKYLFPDIDEERVMAQVEALKKEVWLELKQDMTPFEGAKVISKVFFEIKKFSFETDAGSYFESMSMSKLLETGKSLPIAFVILYAGIAQRLGLHFYGVNLPVPGFLGYVQLKNHKAFDVKNDLMFYLNPFAEGAFFQKASIYEGLKIKYSDKMDEYTGACNNVKFILQYLEFVKGLCVNAKKPVKSHEISKLIEALKVE